MNESDWLILACLALVWAHGIWVGWYIWRKPKLTYKEGAE